MRFNNRIEIYFLEDAESKYNPITGKNEETAGRPIMRSAFVSEPTDNDVVHVFGKVRDGVVRVKIHGTIRKKISHIISKGTRYNVVRQRVTERRNKTTLLCEVANGN